MSPFRARVEKGRLVRDEPTTLPEGTVIDLVMDDEGDDLADEDRRERYRFSDCRHDVRANDSFRASSKGRSMFTDLMSCFATSGFTRVKRAVP